MAGLLEYFGGLREVSSFVGRPKRRKTDYFRRDRAFLMVMRDAFAALQRFANPSYEPRRPRLATPRCPTRGIRSLDRRFRALRCNGRSRTTRSEERRVGKE